jgi:diketogulonate reductase-like aldo/keto reductase
MGGDRLEDGNIFADYRNDRREIDAIRYGLAQGQSHIDTAQLYGAGHTEEIVGEAISGFDRERLFVASKVWRSHSLRHAVPKAAEDSLRKLRLSELDLLYVHAPWDAIPMAEYIGGLNDAVDAGLTRSIGVSNFTTEQLSQAIALSKHPVAAIQLHYNLLERRNVDEGMRGLCAQHGITIVAYRPVERRQLADMASAPLILDAAAEVGCTPAQLAIAWLIGQPNVVTIPKASSSEHIDENLAAMHVMIPDRIRERLETPVRESW